MVFESGESTRGMTDFIQRSRLRRDKVAFSISDDFIEEFGWPPPVIRVNSSESWREGFVVERS